MLVRILYLGLRTYQIFCSPLFPRRCIFYPTCSEYACVALKKWGTVKGCFLIGKRLLRCNSFFAPDFDPVPDGRKK